MGRRLEVSIKPYVQWAHIVRDSICDFQFLDLGVVDPYFKSIYINHLRNGENHHGSVSRHGAGGAERSTSSSEGH